MSPLNNILLLAAGFSPLVAAVNHVVVVGKDGLVFNPPDLKANLGDTLEFRFWAKNHSVVQGNWQTACQPHEDGFFSGFVPQADETKPNGQVFKITLEDTDPKVFYCSQGMHCKNGMVGVINGLGNRTFNAYKSLAAEVTSVGNPSGGVKGGSFEALQANPAPTTTGSSGDGAGGADSTQTTGAGGNTQQTGSGSTTPPGSGAGSFGVSLGALAAAGAFAVALSF